MKRESELAVVLQKLELKKDLVMSKKKKSTLKPRLVQKGDAEKAAVYKWTYQRRK
jgi:U3 small nucleolar RNA-associated protein 11